MSPSTIVALIGGIVVGWFGNMLVTGYHTLFNVSGFVIGIVIIFFSLFLLIKELKKIS